MAAKQIFSNNAILAFLNREIVNRNSELQKRLYYMEQEDVNTLIKKYRSYSEVNPGDKFSKKLPILGYKRSAFKRDENLVQRNTVKVNTSTLDFTKMNVDLSTFFKPNDTQFVDLTSAITQMEYKFYLVGSDLDMVQQYEQAYISRMFLSNIHSFTLDGEQLGLGDEMNLTYTIDWNDLEEFNINADGMQYTMISGSATIRGLVLFSSGVSSYLIEQINLRINDMDKGVLLDMINVNAS